MIALVVTAFAYEWGEQDVVAVPEAPQALVVDGSRVAVVGAQETWGIGADGSVVVAATGGEGAIARDAALWICSDAGLTALPWDDDFGDATVLVDTPCSALVATSAGVLAADPEAWTADDDGAGGLEAPTAVAMTFDGAPLLAANGAEVGGASLGSAGYQVLGTRGVSTYATGGDVAAFGVVGSAWAWTTADPPAVRTAAGDAISLAEADPGAFVEADLDADGIAELVVAHPGALSVVWGTGSTAVVTASVDAFALATRDADADGCAEVLALGSGGLAHFVAVGCGDTRDADADGQTPAEGDCDDDDPWTLSGADEVCDGVDNDCEGDIDEVGSLGIERTWILSEGDTTLFFATVDGCADGVDVSWEVPVVDALDCVDDAGALTCALLDDGDFELAVVATQAGVEVLREAVEVSVQNEAPSCGYARIEDTLLVGETEEVVLFPLDVALDTVTFTLDPAPEGASLAPYDPAGTGRTDGTVIRFEATEAGEFTGTLHATDEDGGDEATTVTFTVEAAAEEEPVSEADECGCYGPARPEAALLLVAGVWRRRRR